MKAAILKPDQRQLTITDVELPQPAPHQVVIQVKACGVCGSDLHLIRHGTMKPAFYPIIPGHEVSGIVERLGEDCTNFAIGDRVVVAPGTSCGSCHHCLAGHENLCAQVGVFGFNANGGFAEKMIVDERYLCPLPDSISFEPGAILADAVSTPYHAIVKQGELQPGESVAIFGTGGLGLHGVAIAKAVGAERIIALDINEGSLERAKAYGATDTINLSKVKNQGKALKQVAGEIDLLADFSGHSENISESVRAMKKGGRMILVGIGRKPLQFSMPFALIEKLITIKGSYGSDRRALPEIIELIVSGRLSIEASVSSIHPLEEVNDCLIALEERKGNPVRFVIDPGR